MRGTAVRAGGGGLRAAQAVGRIVDSASRASEQRCRRLERELGSTGSPSSKGRGAGGCGSPSPGGGAASPSPSKGKGSANSNSNKNTSSMSIAEMNERLCCACLDAPKCVLLMPCININIKINR